MKCKTFQRECSGLLSNKNKTIISKKLFIRYKFIKIFLPTNKRLRIEFNGNRLIEYKLRNVLLDSVDEKWLLNF
ncbi:40700_t:CDS:2 [Gigaspora margarita]|uniref:40700_t:CDS:1 n=1 Tax=Gigaspora margarita TaxID=4874 RepID=A0ABN7UQ72_GIGMA|nr:40700_t:CDS:2 [Gigaspora margarita]